MSYSAIILADSLSPQGQRLTTMEITFPRIVLAEFNTHRALSRNSASSRAIPVEKMIQRVEENPFVPTYWGANQKGMQARQELDEEMRYYAKEDWLYALSGAIKAAKLLMRLGVHKQLANRVLEPFQWHTVIVTATEWDNFFNLRCHPDAQPEIRTVAELMRKALEKSVPRDIKKDEWHRPLLPDYDELKDNFSEWEILKISVARCARVSYLTHAGERDPLEDLRLYDRLVVSEPRHLSPLEHVAKPASGRHGNFRGWQQLRQTVEQGLFA